METSWSMRKLPWKWSTRKRTSIWIICKRTGCWLTHKRTRLRSPSPSPSLHQGKKDVCVCVRLKFNKKVNGLCVKWLRLKIPATLIQNFENLEVQEDEDEDEDEDMDEQESPRSDAKYDLSSGIVRKWREIVCGLDPINGPFDFTSLVKSEYGYTHLAECAALGSVIYALGGDLDNIGDRRTDYILDLVNPRERKSSRITGALVCDGQPSTSPSITSPKHSFGLSKADTCHRFHLCDFSKVIPHWQVSNHPLNTPRFSPKLLSFCGNIYAFGGTHPDDEKAPFVEVYDPNLGFWEAIPNPPFGSLSSNELFVFPLPNSPNNILVLAPYSGISYKLDTLTWMWSPVDACTCDDFRCPCLSRVIYGQVKRNSSPVIYGDTIYWIHRSGPLCAYKFGEDEAKGKYYEGFITGFEDLHIDSHIKEIFDFPLALLPLSRHLLALCWCSTAPLEFGYYWGSDLHISLLRVSLLREFKFGDRLVELKSPSLTASVVVSLTFPFPLDSISLIDAHLIDDEECRELLKPCTDLEKCRS